VSLAVFGTFLLFALIALCWKSGRAVTVAVVAGMLGLTLAGSNGALAEPSRQLVSSVRTTVDSMSASMFGGGHDAPTKTQPAKENHAR
jgi:glycerol uptake facilitator-like aquaporin